MTIYKYTLAIDDEQTIIMPAGARCLTVQVQHAMPQLWALVDPDAAPCPRTIFMCDTGGPVPAADDGRPLRYLGTFQISDGRLVFHVFEPQTSE